MGMATGGLDEGEAAGNSRGFVKFDVFQKVYGLMAVNWDGCGVVLSGGPLCSRQ